MITTPVIKANQSNAAPTEVQMKLAIAQVLSLPFAYNSPVIVLDFEVGNGNVIKGRFKDASRLRIFEFEIDDFINFKPFTWKRIDSADIDPVVWEEFSKGYTYRYDAVKTKRKEKPKCGNTSYNCGKACISLNKNCKSDPPDKPSQEKLDKVKAMAGGFKEAQDDPAKRQENNKLTPKPAGKWDDAASRLGADQVLSSGIAEADPSKIQVDPKRFQYKIIGEQTKSGEVGSLSGVKTWDSNLGGILQVWQDPKDGGVYVVNGHNRLALAKKLNAESVTVKLIDAKSPEEARAIGALTNIAEGRGNAQDAAKFFRDSGLTKQDLEKKGVPMREKIAEDGLALASLSDSLFNRVVQGQIPEQRAVVIGSKIKDHRQQQDLLELVEKEEKKGKKITNDTIEELSDMVTNAPTVTESQGGLFDLLGFSPESRSLAIEKAQIQSAIKRQLQREKRLFSTVGKSKAASDLAKAGNKINVEESSEIADIAEKALGAFDQEKMLTGKVSTLLNQAAEKLANNQKGSAKIIKEVYEQVLDELQKTYRFGKKPSS
jgi:ParB-like chromosome segregation protein Spo0J